MPKIKKKKKKEPRFYTAGQLAVKLGISRTTVWVWTHDGRIPHSGQIGASKSYLYSEEDLAEAKKYFSPAKAQS
jgi:excisionase family DNA binding protein